MRQRSSSTASFKTNFSVFVCNFPLSIFERSSISFIRESRCLKHTLFFGDNYLVFYFIIDILFRQISETDYCIEREFLSHVKYFLKNLSLVFAEFSATISASRKAVFVFYLSFFLFRRYFGFAIRIHLQPDFCFIIIVNTFHKNTYTKSICRPVCRCALQN